MNLDAIAAATVAIVLGCGRFFCSMVGRVQENKAARAKWGLFGDYLGLLLIVFASFALVRKGDLPLELWIAIVVVSVVMLAIALGTIQFTLPPSTPPNTTPANAAPLPTRRADAEMMVQFTGKELLTYLFVGLGSAVVFGVILLVGYGINGR